MGACWEKERERKKEKEKEEEKEEKELYKKTYIYDPNKIDAWIELYNDIETVKSEESYISKHIDEYKEEREENKEKLDVFDVIWVDKYIDNSENTQYYKRLKEKYIELKIITLKKTEEAINLIKKIKFVEIKVILSKSCYFEFVESFKRNILDMYIAPKIIVFTLDKEISGYKDIDIFYKYGGIANDISQVENFLNSQQKKIYLYNKLSYCTFKSDNTQLTFEYIDCKEKLMLPMFFKSLIEDTKNDNLDLYTETLYNTYSGKNDDVKELLDQILKMKNIPIEILSKFYARLYTINSDFYKNINKELRLNKIDNYILFIKTLYEGIKLKALPLSSDKILYRGSKINNSEIDKIYDYLNKKINGLSCAIVFSKSFLSFSKERIVAESFLLGDDEINKSKVLFILEKDDNINYDLSTHEDLENISFYPNEKEVLFLPFSSFEIKEVTKKENMYDIILVYLGKYLKDIESDNNIILNENPIPDSEFKTQLFAYGLIKKEKMINLNTKIIYKEYKSYKSKINNDELGNLLAQLSLKEKDIKEEVPNNREKEIFLENN